MSEDLSHGAENEFIFTNPGPQQITFHDTNDKKIGHLSLESPMTFVGDVDESAVMFFDAVIKLNGMEIRKLRDALEKIDDCSGGGDPNRWFRTIAHEALNDE